jgi:hypothetical protein
MCQTRTHLALRPCCWQLEEAVELSWRSGAACGLLACTSARAQPPDF